MAHFGTALEAELDSVKGKTDEEINRKRKRMLEKWLDMPQRFRSPMGSTKNPDIVHDITVQGEVS